MVVIVSVLWSHLPALGEEVGDAVEGRRVTKLTASN